METFFFLLLKACGGLFLSLQPRYLSTTYTPTHAPTYAQHYSISVMDRDKTNSFFFFFHFSILDESLCFDGRGREGRDDLQDALGLTFLHPGERKCNLLSLRQKLFYTYFLFP